MSIALKNPVAAIDCGTNSIRLLIARNDCELVREMEIVKLGEGVDRTGNFSPVAVERTLAVVKKFKALIDHHNVEKIRFCATSATRDAKNREIFIIPVSKILGITPEVISGDEEAELSFLGATLTQPSSHGPFLVVDIGGGSTEFVLGSGEVLHSKSVNIGCVRMSERYFKSDPPKDYEIQSAREEINRAIDQVEHLMAIDSAQTLIAVAGSATTVAAAALKLTHYDRVEIDGARISAAKSIEISELFLTLTKSERAALGYMHPGRVEVIAAGALVLAEVIRRTGVQDFVASERDMLDGIALQLQR